MSVREVIESISRVQIMGYVLIVCNNVAKAVAQAAVDSGVAALAMPERYCE